MMNNPENYILKRYILLEAYPVCSFFPSYMIRLVYVHVIPVSQILRFQEVFSPLYDVNKSECP